MGKVNLLSFELILFIVLVQWSQALRACRPVFINTRRSLRVQSVCYAVPVSQLWPHGNTCGPDSNKLSTASSVTVQLTLMLAYSLSKCTCLLCMATNTQPMRD